MSATHPAIPDAPAGIDWAAAAQDLASQPELFDPSLLPAVAAQDAPLLSTARAFRYSGAISTRDEARCLAIGMMSLSGRMSLRKIAATVGCDHRTIAAVLRHLESNGQIPTLQARVDRLLSETEHEVLVWIDELIGERVVGRDHAATLRSLFTGAGIAADKRMARDNRLTSVAVNVQVGVAAGPSPEAVRAWEERLRAEFLGAGDSQSGAIEVEAQQIRGPEPRHTSMDTGSAAPASPGLAPDTTPAAADLEAPTLPAGPGGGVDRFAPSPREDAFPPNQ